MDIKTAIERCVSDLSLAPKTKEAYAYGLGRFAEYLHTKGVEITDDISRLNIDHFIYYYPWLNKYSKQTANLWGTASRTLLDWLVTAGILTLEYKDTIRYNSAKLKAHRRRQNRLPRWPKEDDVSKLLKAARLRDEDSPTKERDIALLEFFASTGCRNNEVVQLKVRDLDLKNRTTIVMGKGSKERRVWFSPAAAEAIRAYWAVRKSANSNDPVFSRHDRKIGKGKLAPMSTDTPRNIVKEIMILAGIERGKFSPHYFRHAFAIQALSKTGNLAVVQDLLGHDDPKSTRVYAKIRSEDLQREHRKIFG